MNMSSLSLSVKVHPTVLFQIVNAYERRNFDRTSILGTLLGKQMYKGDAYNVHSSDHCSNTIPLP